MAQPFPVFPVEPGIFFDFPDKQPFGSPKQTPNQFSISKFPLHPQPGIRAGEPGI
jgi:hypothetical protein